MTLEELLQKYFGLKGPLFRSKPQVDSFGTSHWFTVNGTKAYGRFTDCLYDINELCYAACGHYLDSAEPYDINEIIEVFDQFDAEGPLE